MTTTESNAKWLREKLSRIEDLARDAATPFPCEYTGPGVGRQLGCEERAAFLLAEIEKEINAIRGFNESNRSSSESWESLMGREPEAAR